MEKVIETVGELFEIVKSLLAAQKARGEAIDKAITERLARAEQALYDARKEAHERVSEDGAARARRLAEELSATLAALPRTEENDALKGSALEGIAKTIHGSLSDDEKKQFAEMTGAAAFGDLADTLASDV